LGNGNFRCSGSTPVFYRDTHINITAQKKKGTYKNQEPIIFHIQKPGTLIFLFTDTLPPLPTKTDNLSSHCPPQTAHTHQPPKPDPAAPPPHINRGVLSLLQPRASHDRPSSLHCQIKT